MGPGRVQLGPVMPAEMPPTLPIKAHDRTDVLGKGRAEVGILSGRKPHDFSFEVRLRKEVPGTGLYLDRTDGVIPFTELRLIFVGLVRFPGETGIGKDVEQAGSCRSNGRRRFCDSRRRNRSRYARPRTQLHALRHGIAVLGLHVLPPQRAAILSNAGAVWACNFEVAIGPIVSLPDVDSSEHAERNQHTPAIAPPNPVPTMYDTAAKTAANTTDASDTSDAAHTSYAANTSNATDSSNASHATNAADPTNASHATDASNTTDASGATDATGASNAANPAAGAANASDLAAGPANASDLAAGPATDAAKAAGAATGAAKAAGAATGAANATGAATALVTLRRQVRSSSRSVGF